MTLGINATLLKSVVSIETAPHGEAPRPQGTGFLLSHPIGITVLVTAGHVITNLPKPVQKTLGYRLNTKGGMPGKLIKLEELPPRLGYWFFADKADLSIRVVPSPGMGDADVTLLSTNFILSLSQVRPGAPVLVAGFPLGLRSEDYAIPMVRGGVVALVEESRNFLRAVPQE